MSYTAATAQTSVIPPVETGGSFRSSLERSAVTTVGNTTVETGGSFRSSLERSAVTTVGNTTGGNRWIVQVQPAQTRLLQPPGIPSLTTGGSFSPAVTGAFVQSLR